MQRVLKKVKPAKRIIYDFGANDGCDIAYYLLKADMVVAVEANPVLCGVIAEKFPEEIRNGRVVIENCVIADRARESTEFFIPLSGIAGLSHHHSTFIDPDALPEPFRGRQKYKKILLRSQKASDIVSIYGKPYYVKIDIEHADSLILSQLLGSGCRPKFISAESHSIEVFAELVANGGYRHFKLVEGSSVPEVYCNRFFDQQKRRLLKAHSLKNAQSSSLGEVNLACQRFRCVEFVYGSAGPFGEDVDGPWLSADELFNKLSSVGLGWRDIHAKRVSRRMSSKG